MKIYKITNKSNDPCPICNDPACNHVCFYKPTLNVLTRLIKESKQILSLYNDNKIEEMNNLISNSWISKTFPDKNIEFYLDYYENEIKNHLNALKDMELQHPELKDIRLKTINM